MAATQLFTPNWIVKYMVQNSLGAQWLATYPDSPLQEQMEFYITPAEQSPEVQTQLASITLSSLDPEALTLIDPACGSGHILVEAYDLLKAIYLERGYRLRDVPKLILEKNLFGLDIDQRAGQLAGFALMMKGRADDRRLFDRQVGLNVVVFEDSTDFDPKVLVQGLRLADYGVEPFDLAEVKRLFESASVFGSLIQIPVSLAEKLGALRGLCEVVSQDLFVNYALGRLGVLVQQAELLAGQYDVVVANPPYMGGKGMNGIVKKFAEKAFPDAKSDLFACFMERGYTLAKNVGYSAMVTMQSWMFLSSYEKLRERLLNEKTIKTLTQIGYNSFPSMNSKIAQAVVFTVFNSHIRDLISSFINLNNAPQSANKEEVFLSQNQANYFQVSADEFKKIPGAAIAYWSSHSLREIFKLPKIADFLKSDGQILTGNNELFLRYFWEISSNNIGRNKNWKLHHKGGDFRKWYGNVEWVVAWSEEIREFFRKDKTARIPKEELWDLEGITWSTITSSRPSFRKVLEDESFNKAAPTLIATDKELIPWIICTLNSKIAELILQVINPTLNYLVQDIENIPLISPKKAESLIVDVRGCPKSVLLEYL